jgi:hypothetical protein
MRAKEVFRRDERIGVIRGTIHVLLPKSEAVLDGPKWVSYNERYAWDNICASGFGRCRSSGWWRFG